MGIKSITKTLIGEKAVGMIQYLRRPEFKNSWGGPFNGQSFRREMFAELLENIDFSAIIETGTSRGTTTEYMHSVSGLPVYTVEQIPICYGYARCRFMKNSAVRVHHGDSREFLRQLSRNPTLTDQRVFFYLDAHGEEDLPLREEITIIFDRWPTAVVMIDDFHVPGDEGYGYDDYGDDNALRLEYLSPLSHLKLAVFFPSKPADEETGRKRGCVVLAKNAGVIDTLSKCETLASFA